MGEPNKASVGRGAAFIYTELAVVAFSSYVLWLLLSKLTTPDVIGTSSTIISIATIFTVVASFGIPSGLPRFLGKLFSERKLNDARKYVKASIALTGIGIVAASLAILFLRDYWGLGSLDLGLIILCILFMASSALFNLFRYIVISSLRTKLLVKTQIIASTVKIILALTLTLGSLGALGLTSGYTASQIVAAILLALIIVTMLRGSSDRTENRFGQCCRSIMQAGFPSWVPASLTAVGSQLGTVVVFGFEGSAQAGNYFIAYSLFSALLQVSSSLFSAAFPALSAMKDGRKRFTWRTIKLSLIISLPLSFSLIFSSESILGLLGESYVQGSVSMEILMLSIFPSVVSLGINTLVYSYGNYRQVLIIGLALSIPRTLLYFLLVPVYGGAGAAAGYGVGSIFGLAIAIAIAKEIRFRIIWKDLVYMLIIPASIGYVLDYVGIHFIFNIIITMLVTYLALFKLNILTKQDVDDLLSVIPTKISIPLKRALRRMSNKIS